MSAAEDEFNELMRDKERRSAHPEDDHDEPHISSNERSDEDTDDEDSHDDDDNADDDEDDEIITRPSTTLPRHTIPRTRYQANTGPKGVISDAQHFRDSHRVHVRNSQQLSREDFRNGISSREPSPAEKPTMYENTEDLEDDDEDFMRSWRDSRLQQLTTWGQGSDPQHRERGGRSWGGLRTVDGEGYLNAVEKSPADVVVVVYIYDDNSEVSIELEDCVRDLARRRPETRFVKLHFHDAEMEPAGVPALLAYRNGEKFAGFVPLIQEIPDDADVSASTLEVLLKRHQILR